jgi:hypothetical protein
MDEMPPNNNGTPRDTKPEPPNFRLRFFWLVAAHVVVGVLAVISDRFGIGSEWRFSLTNGLILGQISLLGIWACLGGTVLWRRIVGVLAGVGYLTGLWGFFDGWDIVSFVVVLLCATSSMIFVMLIVRLMTGAIYHDRSLSSATRNHQFSIRHLFVLMSVTACVAAILNLILPLVGARDREGLMWTVFYCIVYAVIAIIPLWLILASKRPVRYGICVVAGEAYLAFVLRSTSDPYPNADVLALLALTSAATQAMCVVVTLLIVRSWGYRLMPMRSRRPVVEEGQP